MFLCLALCLFAAVFGVFGSGQAWAANPSDEGCNQDDECRDHFVKGKALYKQQDYTSALTEFQTAYDRRQTPILLANIGRTLQKLGRPKEALDYYQRCQAAATTDTELQEKLTTYIAETKALLAASAPPEAKPEPSEPAPAPLNLNPSKASEPSKPVYKKAWFWVVIGVGAAAVVGGVVAGVLLRPMPDPPLDPTITVIRPMF
jgi:tetratricopeptide (TPR) repeat protein